VLPRSILQSIGEADFVEMAGSQDRKREIKGFVVAVFVFDLFMVRVAHWGRTVGFVM